MHATHSILVHVPSAVEEDGRTLSDMSKEELTACVVEYAQKMTEPFYGPVFDSQDLLEEGEDEDYPSPVLFSKDNWAAFKDWLIMCDKAQKRYAAFLCNKIKEDSGSGDICTLIANDFLSYNSDDDIDFEEICRRSFRDVRWEIKTLANLFSGTYCFDSDFYNTYEGNAFVPYLRELKNEPDDWALVAFDCHW